MIPFKTCNCNCVYCECGGGKVVSHERREYIPAEEIIAELDHYLATSPPLDYVTFAGSGEPTLNTALGAVLQFVKVHYPQYRTALLTNGTLFHLPEVRAEALPFDLILPSLDAVTEEMFARINRPFPGCSVDTMIEGLVTFAHAYTGQLWVEVFIVPGSNDTASEITRFKEVLQRIQPARVQLNSLDRPGACDWVTTASVDSLQQIAEQLLPLPVEIISRNAVGTHLALPVSDNCTATILHQLLRRPAPVEEIAVLCSVTINEITPLLGELVAQNKLEITTVNGRVFYSVRAPR